MNWFITNCQAIIDQNGGIILSLFLLGLISGLTHCVGMCGPFVLMQTGRNDAEDKPFLGRLIGRLLLPYHMGRMATYILLGGIGAAASNILFGQTLKQFAAVALISMAIFLIARFVGTPIKLPVIHRSTTSGFTNFIAKIARVFSGKTSGFSSFFLGMTLGLIPCGLLYGALFAAAVVAEPVSASIAMGAFALGTMPALFLVGVGGQFLKKTWPNPVQKIQHTLIGINGAALMIIGGGMLL